MAPPDNIKQTLKEIEHWMATPGVEGIGEGSDKGKTCIVVFISVEPSALKGIIPSVYNDFPVILQETGMLQIQ